MDEKIILPKRIEESIGYCAWTALSWALNFGWVQDYKLLFSQREGKDVGAPYTIETMTSWSPQGLVSHNDDPLLNRGAYHMFMDRCYKDSKDISEFRNLMIEGYLSWQL